jgi:hypothetical protein
MAEFYLHSDRTVPAIDFLNRCPVADRIEAIVEAVRSFPPPSFPPSQMWHVMSDEMKGFYEIRVRYRQTLHRLFCILDANGAKYGLDGPVLVLISGGTKPIGRAMPTDVYTDAIEYRDRYKSTTPRPVVR